MKAVQAVQGAQAVQAVQPVPAARAAPMAASAAEALLRLAARQRAEAGELATLQRALCTWACESAKQLLVVRAAVHFESRGGARPMAVALRMLTDCDEQATLRQALSSWREGVGSEQPAARQLVKAGGEALRVGRQRRTLPISALRRLWSRGGAGVDSEATPEGRNFTPERTGAARARAKKRGRRLDEVEQEIQRLRGDLLANNRRLARALRDSNENRAWRRRLARSWQGVQAKRQLRQAAERRVAAIRVLPAQEKQDLARFHSAEVDIEYATAEGKVRAVALADTGAYAGFMSSYE